jgi:hypothetical protein
MKYEILIKMPYETRASVRERLNSHTAAIAVLREYTSILKREGFRSAQKPKDNKKMWFFRGEETITIHLRFRFDDIDVKRRVEGLTFEENLLY